MLDAHLIVLLYLRHDACVCVRVLRILLPEHLYIHLLECTGSVVVVAREGLAHVVGACLFATLVEGLVILYIVLNEWLLVVFAASFARKLLLLKLAFGSIWATLHEGGVPLRCCHVCSGFCRRPFLWWEIDGIEKSHNLVVIQVA